MSLSKSKNYTNLRFYLQRNHKIQNSGKLAYFLLEKFTNCNLPTQYVKIFKSELEQHEILKKDDRFYEWRDEMCSKNILICKATHDEKKSMDPNYKASEFRFGDNIKKYIETALSQKSSVFERLDKKADFEYVDSLEQRMNERLEMASSREKIADLELKVEDISNAMESLILYVMPPDTEARRLIVQKHKYEREKCIEALEEEKNSRILRII